MTPARDHYIFKAAKMYGYSDEHAIIAVSAYEQHENQAITTDPSGYTDKYDFAAWCFGRNAWEQDAAQ